MTRRKIGSRPGAQSRQRSYYNRRVHFVYIVRCADRTLYTGYARDPGAREKMHNSGRGARYTAGRRPVRLVYSESFRSIGDALRRERQLKRWRRARKEALVRLLAEPATRSKSLKSEV